jgi:Tol biopolymer transport system component/DNA-binding winged helix-turn-helix (wHTH) protein
MSLNLELIYSEFNLNVASDSDRIIYLFEEYRLDVSRRMLYRGREELALPPKAIETLLALIELRGEIVSKDDLMRIIWTDAIVEESNLAHYLHVLRKLLGNKPDGKPFIETFRRRGYRFTSEVCVIEEPDTPKNGVKATVYELKNSQIEDWKRENAADFTENRNASVRTSGAPRSFFRNRQRLSAAAAFTGFFVLAMLLYFLFQPVRSDKFANIRTELSVMPLTSGQLVLSATISPDGKYFVYHEMDGEKTHLWLQQTGQTSRIEIIPPSELIIAGKTFMPDGEYVYFPALEKGETKFSLYRVLTLGGNLTKILNDIASPVSFSPDGSEMVFVRYDEQTKKTQLLTAAADGGAEQVRLTTKDSESLSTGGVGWSPDGKFIAYGVFDKNSVSGEGVCTIAALELHTGTVRKLSTEKWDTCYRMVWTPDGAGLVFTGTREGESYSLRRDTIYYLSIADGTTRCITSDGNRYQDQSVSVTNDNAILVVPSKRLSQVWAMNSNGDSRTAVQLTNGQSDGRAGIAPLPDGRIGYIRRIGENLSLWTMKSDGSDVRQISNQFQFIENLNATPDGRFFIFSARRDRFSHLYRIDTDGANLRQLTDGESYEIDSTISPDSRWVYYDMNFKTDARWKTELRKIAIDGGEPIVLREFGTGNLIPQISPDGRFIVGLTGAEFRIFSASDGAPVQSLETDKKAELLGGAKWSPDGKSLTYLVSRQGTQNIWQQPLDGSAPRPLTDFPKGIVYQYAFSSDRTHLYLARGYQAFDAVLIRNFQ